MMRSHRNKVVAREEYPNGLFLTQVEYVSNLKAFSDKSPTKSYDWFNSE